jgi:hypothetical protein
MKTVRSAAWLGRSALALGLLGACQGEGSRIDSGSIPGTSGSGGTTGGIDLDVGEATDDDAGAAGQPAGPSVAACEGFDGLDQCGVTSVAATFSAANVLLVIDKSSSMDDQPAGFELKKWQALTAALEPALTAVQDEMSFGLLLYPFGAQAQIPLDCFDNCCEVPTGDAALEVGIEPGSGSVTKVMHALRAATPGGGTPTAAALDAALAYFTAGDGRNLKGDRFVLLATDGGPNCGAKDAICAADRCTPNLDGLCPADQGNCCTGEGSYCLDDMTVVEKIRALAAASVPTFVIGIPGTESYADYLNAFATAGGVPNPSARPDYYAVSAEGGVEGLTQTFRDITTHLVRSCAIELGGAPNEHLLNVAVDCNVVPRAEGDGWSITADEPATLVLAGDACEQVKREGARRIDVVYGCPTVK